MHQHSELPLRPLLLPSCCFHTTLGELSCHIKIAPSHFEVENARSTSTTLLLRTPIPVLLILSTVFFSRSTSQRKLQREGDDGGDSCGLAALTGGRHAPQSKAASLLKPWLPVGEIHTDLMPII